MSNEDIKMSDVFDLPVQSGADGCVYDLHYSRICTSGSNSKEITHAINNHDPMALRIKELEAALEMIILANRTDCGGGFLTAKEVAAVYKALEQS